MINKILPLPVKKNKFGERVTDISIEKYYRQIFEEVLEAHEWQYTVDENREHSYEAEELVDVMACCIICVMKAVDIAPLTLQKSNTSKNIALVTLLQCA